MEVTLREGIARCREREYHLLPIAFAFSADVLWVLQSTLAAMYPCDWNDT